MERIFLGVMIVKQTVRKAFWNYEKEEKWLNEMAAKGLALTDYSRGCYVFADCTPGEYIYRIELLKNPLKHVESQKYLSFMEENGIDYIASSMNWVYFRKKASEGAFDIYSDIESKLAHYKRIYLLWSSIMVANLLIGLYNVLLAICFLATNSNYPSSINLFSGILSLAISILFFFGLFCPVRKKIKKLKSEQRVRE